MGPRVPWRLRIVGSDPTVAYTAGPFRASTPWGVEQNVRRAERVSLALWTAGIVPLCPHAMYRHFDGFLPDEDVMDGTLELLRRCDVVVVLPGWQSSTGTRKEIEEAADRGIPVYFLDVEVTRSSIETMSRVLKRELYELLGSNEPTTSREGTQK